MPDHYVMFWNVENLFDVDGSPRRSEKLERTLGSELTGWTQEVLDRKISQLAKVVSYANGGKGPDLLGVCEVENRFVLERLCQAVTTLNRNYEIVHADTQDGRGIDVAFIYDPSRFTPVPGQVFYHFIVRRVATRDLVQVSFRTAAGRTLVVIGNHWPARLEGKLESEPYRIIAGETLAYFHERIRQELGTDTAVLAMGDFNDEPFDRSIVDYACCERQRTKVTRATSARFLNLMWPLAGQGLGTHYYDNSVNLLDQFMASRSLVTGAKGLTALPGSVEIVRFPEMVSTGAYPSPIRFGRGEEINPNGFADHFPIGMVIHET
ncbi:MAG TPA: endonuclease/exonuclease/phosphatase family protein [Longimicrobium sp.]